MKLFVRLAILMVAPLIANAQSTDDQKAEGKKEDPRVELVKLLGKRNYPKADIELFLNLQAGVKLPTNLTDKEKNTVKLAPIDIKELIFTKVTLDPCGC